MNTARSRLHDVLDSASMAQVFALAAFGVVFASHAIESTAGLVTLATMVAGLCVTGVAILWVRRAEWTFLRLVPATLGLFVVWAGVTLLFPSSRGGDALSWLALVGFGTIAVVVAHIRDTLQTVRALGDVLRVMLTLSLAVEMLSGVFFDMPFPFLGVQGNLAEGGPIQGLFGTRNMLGLVCVIALITFVIEIRTHSIERPLGVFSLIIGGGLAALTSSPTVIVLGVVVAATTGVLAIIRHTQQAHRPRLQWALAAMVVIGLVVVWLFRNRLVALIGAGPDVAQRAQLWDSILNYVRYGPWQGWGWRGPWDPNDPHTFPYNAINAAGERHASALNSYFDVLLQVGAVGLVLLLVACGAALVRSWLIASDRRSVLYAWTPLVLVTLLVDSVFDSFTIVGIGWMMLVLCTVRAVQGQSWRDRIDVQRAGEAPGAAG